MVCYFGTHEQKEALRCALTASTSLLWYAQVGCCHPASLVEVMHGMFRKVRAYRPLLWQRAECWTFLPSLSWFVAYLQPY